MAIEGLEPSNYYHSLLFDQYNLNYSSVAYFLPIDQMELFATSKLFGGFYHFAYIALFDFV